MFKLQSDINPSRNMNFLVQKFNNRFFMILKEDCLIVHTKLILKIDLVSIFDPYSGSKFPCQYCLLKGCSLIVSLSEFTSQLRATL